jgi:hypothetical protein
MESDSGVDNIFVYLSKAAKRTPSIPVWSTTAVVPPARQGWRANRVGLRCWSTCNTDSCEQEIVKINFVLAYAWLSKLG